MIDSRSEWSTTRRLFGILTITFISHDRRTVLVDVQVITHLLVVHVAGAADERGPAFGMKLQGGDAVPSVPLSWDLWSQNLQAVPGRKACADNSYYDSYNRLSRFLLQRRTSTVWLCECLGPSL